MNPEMSGSRSASNGTHPDVSVIVPTRNEAENIAGLLARIYSDLPIGLDVEIVFVDDSTDETPEIIQSVAACFPLTVAVYHRSVPKGGLSGAVVAGIGLTRAPWIVVMDADLQHPPSLITQLVAQGERSIAELVVASRYADGGYSNGPVGTFRDFISCTAARLSRILFPRVLRSITDPLSGCFAIRREAIERAVHKGGEWLLQPNGFKILLELAVRCRPQGIAEVSYKFGKRNAGKSKFSLREGMRFARHVAELRTSTVPWRSGSSP